MSDQQPEPPKAPEPSPGQKPGVDSFGVPVEKSPWLVYALLQIPIVIIMVVIIYFMYQSRQN